MLPKLTFVDSSSPDIDRILYEHRIKLGKNVVFRKSCYFGDAVTVGDNVVFCGESRIGGHTVIESGAKIGSGCEIGEGSFIGKEIIIGDGVFLPGRTYVAEDRRSVIHSEEFTAVFSSARKTESFFGSDKILMFDPEVGQDYETSMSFREFITKAKIRQRVRIKQEETRGEFLKAVSSFIGVLKNIGNKKE
jgi:carbonic anhydrase/acetyltransferase-like protein (isoleucine patch superfamily)